MDQNQRNVKDKYVYSSLLIGGINGGAINQNQTTEAIRITNTAGAAFEIDSFSFIYNGSAEDNATAQFIDNQKNRPIILGTVQFSNIGMRRGNPTQFSVFKLPVPFFLVSGQSTSLIVTNPNVAAIAAGDLSLVLIGVQMVSAI